MVQLEGSRLAGGPLVSMLACWQPFGDGRPDLVWPSEAKLLEPLEAMLKDFYARRYALATPSAQQPASYREARGVVVAGKSCADDRMIRGRRLRLYRGEARSGRHWSVVTAEHHGAFDCTEEVILDACFEGSDGHAVSLESYLERSMQDLQSRGLGAQASSVTSALAKEAPLTTASRVVLETILRVHDEVQALLGELGHAKLTADQFIVTVLERIAVSYMQSGEPRKANQCFWRALRIQESLFGQNSLEVAMTLMNLGSTYGDLGDPWEKRSVLERCLQIRGGLCGWHHPEVAKALANLANAHGDIGDPQKKRELLERALGIMTNAYGPSHLEVARLSTNLGNAFGVLGHPEKKREFLEEALRIMTAECGADHVNVAIILANLGAAYSDLGQAETSLKHLRKALQIKELHFGKDHVEVAVTRLNLANCLHRLADTDGAIREAEAASGVFLVAYGAESHQVVSSRKLLTSWRLHSHSPGYAGSPTTLRSESLLAPSHRFS